MSNCVFGDRDIVQIHLHWELLNPYENLLQMQGQELIPRQWPAWHLFRASVQLRDSGQPGTYSATVVSLALIPRQ